jgi:hypothetical protein
MSQAPPAAAGRGLLLIGASVVLGLILLSQGFDDGSATSARGSNSSNEADVSSETTLTIPDETIPGALDPSQVPVVVSNAAGVSGLAGEVTAELQALGYLTSEPETSATLSDFTAVFYEPNFEAEALEVATSLGYPPDQVVQPMPDPAPAGSGTEIVVVVLGADVTSFSGDTTATTVGGTDDTLLAPG